MFAENSDTLRDLLNRKEKLSFITSTRQWMLIRDVRNRIVHDYFIYQTDDLKRTCDTIQKPFEDELRQLKAKLVNLKSARLEN